MGANGRIDLVVPGLFGPIRVLPEDLPDLRTLARLLGKADRQSASGPDLPSLLFDRFGIDRAPDRDPPSAPFSHLADAPDVDQSGFWLHADPVHLRPDRSHLLLFDARHLAIEQAEADALVALFNRHFEEDGLRLEAPTRRRWYLHLEQAPRIRTRALSDVAGRSVERPCVEGEDAAQWIRWLNEAQMLFHHSEVNRDRELTGRPSVSGIWPWGGGALPAAMPESRYESVFGRDPLVFGLAKAAGIPVRALPGDPEELPAVGHPGRLLLLWDALWPVVLDGDAASWVSELSRLGVWLEALTGRLGRNGVGEIVLYPCDGTRLRVTRRALRRFWRGPLGISERLRGTPAD